MQWPDFSLTLQREVTIARWGGFIQAPMNSTCITVVTVEIRSKDDDDANQVFMAGFPESSNVQTKSLKSVLVVKVLMKKKY